MCQLKNLLYVSLLISTSTPFSYWPKLQDPLTQPLPPLATPSRRIVLRGSSNSIFGSYSLYDLLSISTQSGSISINVTPHSASSQNPQPATLELRSQSGSVHATLSEAFIDHHTVANGAPDSDDDVKSGTHAYLENIAGEHGKAVSSDAATQSSFLDREYITSISTQSGSISGNFPLGTRTGLDSRSGSFSNVELVVMPANMSEPRRLSTVSRDGSQSVRIVECYGKGGKREAWWDGMLSKHESRSGSINVEYPDSWEGTIEVETGSGSVSVTGRGVEIIREERGRVVAQKGEGSGKVIVRAGSGRVDLRFG